MLNDFKNIFLRGKRHFHIQLIELSGRTIGTRIFIAETRRNLEILVKTGNHQQLFELLRSLRQRVKFARINTGRHQKIARTLRRRSSQNRRLILGKALFNHQTAHRGNNF